MFTGLIEEVGTIASLERSASGARLEVVSGLEGLALGESISINGACQTVARITERGFSCDILQETLRVTNLGLLRAGDRINLERAMGAGARFGGHIVNGHVDGVGRVVKVSKRPFGLEVAVDEPISRYIVSKGSVALDGISLTVGPHPRRGRFEVYIIPHTWENTNLRYVRTGNKVNIEVDIIGKYVEAFMRKEGGEHR